VWLIAVETTSIDGAAIDREIPSTDEVARCPDRSVPATAMTSG
jgi:hypothetical protein